MYILAELSHIYEINGTPIFGIKWKLTKSYEQNNYYSVGNSETL